MDLIFHEKQEGQLCAKHCLNSLLQSSYFTEIDLATIAENIDSEEKKTMAEGGENREEYQQFISKPSRNMDDSGYFSVQVIQRALQIINLELIPFNSQSAISQKAREDPTSQKSYICNFRDHWFTVRKIGLQWFNLNSLLSGPELISDTYLSLFLHQLQKEGYSIFVVAGDLPKSDSDSALQDKLVEQPVKPKLKVTFKKVKSEDEGGTSSEYSITGAGAVFDEDQESLERAIKASLENTDDDRNSVEIAIQASLQSELEDEKRQLEAAIAASLGKLQ